MKIKSGLIVATTLIAIAGAGSVSAGWLDKLSEVVKENVGEDSPISTGSLSKESLGKSLSNTPVSIEEMTEAFKQALDIGSKKVVEQLGKTDGFNADQAIRIPLPEKMQTVKKWLDKVGLGDSMNDLETSLNRAAENAAPKARSLFVDTIKQMSFEDVKSIYNGGDDAATRYFQEKMTPALTKEMAPVVEQSLSEVGTVKLYDDIMGQYKSIPFVPDVKADLTGHVVDGGLNGIFHYIAKEEAEIRKNPVKRTTELLQRVFGSK